MHKLLWEMYVAQVNYGYSGDCFCGVSADIVSLSGFRLKFKLRR